MKKYLSIIFIVFIIMGCGYKPTNHYVKKQLGYNSKYYVNMNIAVNNAKNSVIIKDAVNEAVINRFSGRLVDRKDKADTILNVSLSSVSTKAIQYDTNPKSSSYGYANLYRTTVKIKVDYSNVKSNGSFTVNDYYEFAVNNSSVLSDTKKFQAIKNATSKAFDKVISSIAVRSIEREKSQDLNATKSN